MFGHGLYRVSFIHVPWTYNEPNLWQVKDLQTFFSTVFWTKMGEGSSTEWYDCQIQPLRTWPATLYYEAIPILKLKHKKSNYRTRSKELQSKHAHTHTHTQKKASYKYTTKTQKKNWLRIIQQNYEQTVLLVVLLLSLSPSLSLIHLHFSTDLQHNNINYTSATDKDIKCAMIKVHTTGKQETQFQNKSLHTQSSTSCTTWNVNDQQIINISIAKTPRKQILEDMRERERERETIPHEKYTAEWSEYLNGLFSTFCSLILMYGGS